MNKKLLFVTAASAVVAACLNAEDLTDGSVAALMNGGSSTYLLGDAADFSTDFTDPMILGLNTSYNALTIQNNAYIYATSDSGVVIGSGSAANHNTAVVTGEGTTFDIDFALVVGLNGSDNSLTIQNNGAVYSKTGTIGSEVGSTDNTVSVLSGGLWDVRGAIYVGKAGDNSSLNISGGSTVLSNAFYIGSASGGNEVAVNGLGSLLKARGTIYVGQSGSYNTLSVTNGASTSGSSLEIGYTTGYSNNTVTVSSDASVSITNNVFLGRTASSNNLNVLSGATLRNTSGYLGYNSGSTGNIATVSGTGSKWTNSASLYVGYNGANNQLNVSSAGSVSDVNGYIGYGSTGNSVTVDGQNSIWTNSNSLTVNSGNSLTISNHALVIVGSGGLSLTGSLNVYDGYLAVSGDVADSLQTLLAGGYIFYKDSTGTWVSAAGTTDRVTILYCATNAEASDFTDGVYTNLGGYTILTVVPEPATYALFGGFAALALVFIRRRRTA